MENKNDRNTLIKVGTSEHVSLTASIGRPCLVRLLIHWIIFLLLRETLRLLATEIITANRIKLGRNNFRSLGGEGIHIDLSTDAAKILENNSLIYNCWYQLYIDNIHQLLIRPRKWEKSGWLP